MACGLRTFDCLEAIDLALVVLDRLMMIGGGTTFGFGSGTGIQHPVLQSLGMFVTATDAKVQD